MQSVSQCPVKINTPFLQRMGEETGGGWGLIPLFPLLSPCPSSEQNEHSHLLPSYVCFKLVPLLDPGQGQRISEVCACGCTHMFPLVHPRYDARHLLESTAEAQADSMPPAVLAEPPTHPQCSGREMRVTSGQPLLNAGGERILCTLSHPSFLGTRICSGAGFRSKQLSLSFSFSLPSILFLLLLHQFPNGGGNSQFKGETVSECGSHHYIHPFQTELDGKNRSFSFSSTPPPNSIFKSTILKPLTGGTCPSSRSCCTIAIVSESTGYIFAAMLMAGEGKCV